MRRSDLFLAISIALFAAEFALARYPLAVAVAATASIVTWSFVEVKRYVPNVLMRRALRALPYFVPLPIVGINTAWSWVGMFLGVALGAAILAIGWRGIAQSLNPLLLELMRRPSRQEAWSETVFYLLPALAQEYLYRYVWLTVLTNDAGLEPYLAVITTSAMFSAEHLLGGGKYIRLSAKMLISWLVLGCGLGALVLLSGSLWPAVICHLIINAPSAIQPHLRGKIREPN